MDRYSKKCDTIGEYENQPLNLQVGTSVQNPYKRLISYQAYRAFIKWNTLKTCMKDQFPADCDVSEYDGSYRMTGAKFAQQLAQDFAADEEEDDGEASQED